MGISPRIQPKNSGLFIQSSLAAQGLKALRGFTGAGPIPWGEAEGVLESNSWKEALIFVQLPLGTGVAFPCRNSRRRSC